MKCFALAASLALASATSGVKFVDTDDNTASITFKAGVLTVPQHCRADVCESLVNLDKAQAEVNNRQADENKELYRLIASLRKDLKALAKKHGDEIDDLEDVDDDFHAADKRLT